MRLYLFIVSVLALISVNFGEFDDVSIEDITQLSYHKTVFIEYDESGNPLFYENIPKTYYIRPITVCPVGLNTLQKMGFKIDNEDYDVMVSAQVIETNKSAIFFAPPENSEPYRATSKIYWIIVPLNCKVSIVKSKYKLPKVGKIIAVYEDGSPACVKIENKIYCGFDANREVLYNLLYIFMIYDFPYELVTAVGVLTFSSALIILLKYPKVKVALDKVGSLVFCRIALTNKDKVLTNNTRNEVYRYILCNPGCYLREMSKNLGKSTSTLTWHLRVLEKSGLITSKKFGNKIIYYPSGMRVDNPYLLPLKSEISKRIYEYLRSNPAHLRKIASDLNANVETIRYNLKKMEKLSIVCHRKEGNKIIYYINPDIHDM